MIIECQYGLGDNLYFRPVLKWLPKNNIKLITSWPQVYHDIEKIKFIKPLGLTLRTQKENADRDDIDKLYTEPYEIPEYKLSYNFEQGSSMGNFFNIVYGQQPSWIDNSMVVPESWIEKAKHLYHTDKPIALIRLNTLRQEWYCPARNPKGEYLQRFINKYRKDFYFITLANICNGYEWVYEKLTNVDQELYNTTYEETVGLFTLSKVIVCSPSFWVPLGQILKSRMLVIYGAHEEHYRINDHRLDSPNLIFVEPDPFERCNVRKPNAYKDIDTRILDAKFEEIVKCC